MADLALTAKETGRVNLSTMLQAFSRWREASCNLVLATVYETAGSTYSKAGARMLIAADGRFQGMLSGGCLEGDLAERAAAVSRSGMPECVSYDLGADDDALWGLGVGCDGLMRIFLQPLTAGDDYQPFAAMAGVYAGDRPGAAATVIESAHASFCPGASIVRAGAAVECHGIDARFAELLAPELDNVGLQRRALLARRAIEGKPVALLFAALQPPPRILVLGGGLDAEPVVRLIADLGWRVVVQDHREAYIRKGRFDGAERVINVPADGIAAALDLNRIDAAIVMSHHLATDRVYLDCLAGSAMPYIGLLGPIDRRRRLLHELGPAADRLAGRLHGPAGIDLGGRGPASIALSIVSEMHQVLMRD